MANVYSCIYLDSDYVDGTESYAGELNATNRDAKYGSYPTGRYFTSLSAWEADRDGNLSPGDDEHAIIVGPWISHDTNYLPMRYDGETDVEGHVTCPLTLPDGDNLARHNGIWNDVSNSYVLSVTAHAAFEFVITSGIVDGLQIEVVAPNADSQKCIYAISMVADSYYTVKNCICKMHGSASYTQEGVRANNTNPDVIIENTIVFNGGTAIFNSCFISNGDVVRVYNCIFTDAWCGMDGDNATTCDVVNCAIFNGTEAYNFWGNPDSVTYTTSDETMAGTGNIDWDNGATDWAANFEGYVTGDFRPKNQDLPSAGVGPGTDANVPTTDIIGNSRSGSTCTIGAFEYVASGPIGWTGIINTIINPAKINSIAVANIKNINGVE